MHIRDKILKIIFLLLVTSSKSVPSREEILGICKVTWHSCQTLDAVQRGSCSSVEVSLCLEMGRRNRRLYHQH